MNLTINEIQMVKVVEKHFDVERMTDFNRWHYELYSDAIVTYRMEKGSQKKLGKSITPIAKDEMKAFFKELYDFVRTAEMSCETIDDCSHEVTFIYGPLHREIFEGATIKGHEDLIHKITSFINAHRGRADE